VINAKKLWPAVDVTKTGPALNRHRSKQDYQTPAGFMRAFEECFGPIGFDLAAHAQNTQHEKFFGVEEDSLRQNWERTQSLCVGWLWLNPPFNNIKPWAAKCDALREEMGWDCSLAFLVPASVGSNWWREYVHLRAQVHFLSPRLSFDGKNPFPKDIALCLYGMPPGYECWRWK